MLVPTSLAITVLLTIVFGLGTYFAFRKDAEDRAKGVLKIEFVFSHDPQINRACFFTFGAISLWGYALVIGAPVPLLAVIYGVTAVYGHRNGTEAGKREVSKGGLPVSG